MRLILNADDLGMSDAVNDAVATGLAEGWLTSATLLANGPAFAGAVAVARRFPRASFGVHLNVTEFAPLSDFPAEHLEDGRLCARTLDLPAHAAGAVEAEWSAQIARVLAAGLLPTHVDSHQHLHQRPALFGALAAVVRRHGIPRVRPRGWLLPPGTAWDRRARARLGAALFHTRLRALPVRTVDLTCSVTRLRERLARGGRPEGTIEGMVHPGNPHAAVYAEEVAWLRGGGLATLGPVTRVGWDAV